MAEWRWILHDAAGKDLRSTDAFSSKEEAEAWMGDNWAALLDEGAETVSLRSDGDHQYRMGLREG
jgi:hypothetical protein